MGFHALKEEKNYLHLCAPKLISVLIKGGTLLFQISTLEKLTYLVIIPNILMFGLGISICKNTMHYRKLEPEYLMPEQNYTTCYFVHVNYNKII